MNKFITGLFTLAVVAGLSSCEDKDKQPAPSIQSVALVNATVSTDAAKQKFNLIRSQYSDVQLAAANETRPVFEFTLDLYGQRDLKVTKVYVYKTFRRGRTNYTYGPRVLAREVTSFPTTLTFDSQDALQGLQRIGTSTVAGRDVPTLFDIKASTPTGRNLLFPSDAVVFTFEYDAEVNGETRRIILTPLTQVNITAPAVQKVDVISGTQIIPPYAVVAEFNNF